MRSLLLIVGVLFTLWLDSVHSWGNSNNDSVLLSDVKCITLEKGRMTNGRRSSPVPQLTCVGGSAGCHAFQPTVVQCLNQGSDGYDAQWECKTDMNADYRFGRIQVSCEGYEYPEDPYVLGGSCGLEYEIDLTDAVDEDKGKAKFDKTNKVLTITLPILPPPPAAAAANPQPQIPLVIPLDADTGRSHQDDSAPVGDSAPVDGSAPVDNSVPVGDSAPVDGSAPVVDDSAPVDDLVPVRHGGGGGGHHYGNSYNSYNQGSVGGMGKIFQLIIAAVIFYAVYKCFCAGNRHRMPPNPTPTPTSSSYGTGTSGQQGTAGAGGGPGFFTGAAAGGLLGYLFGNRGGGYGRGYGGGYGYGRGYGGGGYGGSSWSARPSSGWSSGWSSGTRRSGSSGGGGGSRTTSGFGGTSRR